MRIQISLDNLGNISITSDADKYAEATDLSADEQTALDLIREALSQAGINAAQIHAERRTDKYLSIVYHEVHDFLRIKLGKRARWFSIFVPNKKMQPFASDARLNHVKKTNLLHWKIPLTDVSDLQQYTDLIQCSCKSCKIED